MDADRCVWGYELTVDDITLWACPSGQHAWEWGIETEGFLETCIEVG